MQLLLYRTSFYSLQQKVCKNISDLGLRRSPFQGVPALISSFSGGPAAQNHLPNPETGWLVEHTSSTFEDLFQLYQAGSSQPWDWIIAFTQKEGKGQYGRTWESGLGNLHVSQILPNQNTISPNFLPVLLARETVLLLRDVGYPALLKWPNDIVLDVADGKSYQKAGGLLLEQKQNYSALGLGLNLIEAPKNNSFSSTKLGWPPPKPSIEPGRNFIENLVDLWAAISLRIQHNWPLLILEYQQRPQTLREKIESLLIWLHQPVFLIAPQSKSGEQEQILTAGTLKGISPEGKLVLLEQNREREYTSGTLRLQTI